MRLMGVDPLKGCHGRFVVPAVIGLFVSIFLAGSSAAATRIAPKKQHIWQTIGASPAIRAEARACTDCPAALELKCLGGPGSGLLELSLPVAGVANGRVGASKQIRLIAGGHVMQRRATTLSRHGLFVPQIVLGADDGLFARLESAHLLELSFYGQRAYVGLGSAGQRAIHAVRAACWPDLDRPRIAAKNTAICTWHVPLGCYQSKAAAKAAGQAHAVRTLLARQESAWCARAVIDDLAAARTFAGSQETYPRRRCVWVEATSGPPGAAPPRLTPDAPAGQAETLPGRQP